jgi:predicted ATP-grasp superfamily ATP-dependent carboligase
MNVFVTDGDERPALAATRSLGRRGCTVVVGAERAATLAGASRYCARRVVYPSPHRDPDGFREFVLAFLTRERIDVVLPVTDVTTRLVAADQEAIRARAALAVAPIDAFEAVTDKARLFEQAAALGVPTPATVTIANASELPRVRSAVRYPAVVKPFRSRIPAAGGWIGTTVHYAETSADLERIYARHEYLACYPSLIQTRVIGPGVGLFALFDRGRLLTAFAHRRLREKPPSGGVSVLRESVDADPVLVDCANRLLAPLGWHGVAMVEFKRDRQTGQPFLMEVNGRFWGSLQLAIDAGVDFPLLACQLALGGPVDLPSAYRVGVRSRWLLGDLDHLLLRLFRRDCDLRLPEDAPSRARTLLAFARCLDRNLYYEVLRRDDLRPFLHESARYVGGALSSAWARVRPRRRSTPHHAAQLYDPKRYPHAGSLE